MTDTPEQEQLRKIAKEYGHFYRYGQKESRMKADWYHNAEKNRMEVAIYPENKAEEVMFKVLHEHKCKPELDATGNQPYFCRIRIAVPVDF